MKHIRLLKKQLFTFIPAAVLFMLISVSTTQARYELERGFIGMMPQVSAGPLSAMQTIGKLNAGMMNRGTGRETSFSTQLWRDSASLCTNGAMYGIRKTLITAEEFVPFSQNIIMQASGLKNREDAYLHSFSDEGFKNRRIALHQLHHFFFMRAAQITQESDGKERKQTKEKMADRVSKAIYSELSWLSAGLPSSIFISSINLEGIKQSLGRFDYLFFTLLQRDQETIQEKVATGTTPSWENEDRINFICDQGTRRLAKIAVAVDSPLQKDIKSLQAMYQEMRQIAQDPQKRYAPSSSLFLIRDLERSLKSDPDGMFVETPTVTLFVEGKICTYATPVLRKERVGLIEELRNVVRDLRQVEFLAIPFNLVPPKIDPIEDIPEDQLRTGVSIGKQYLVYPFRVFTFDLDPHYVRALSKMLNARSNTLEYQELGDKIYFNGFVIIDPEKERHSLKLWAERGKASDQISYACHLLEGTSADFAQARIYFKLAADQGDPIAQHKYAYMLLKGEGGAPDPIGARNYFKMAADQGLSYARNKYSSMLLKGEGGPTNRTEAIRYLKMEMKHVSAEDLNTCAYVFYEAGELKEARNHFKLAADKGHVNAQNRYASMLLDGEGGPTDRTEAIRYLKMVVAHGTAEDLNTCACTFCEAGELKEARSCFKLAADKGHIYAAAAYAEMAYEGEGGSRDLRQALVYVKKALQKKEGSAQLLYGRMLLKGEDGPADPTEARRYVKMAALADKDNIQAQELYALMLIKGEGGPTDSMEAQRRFKMGAERLQLGINEGKVSMGQLKEYADKGSVFAQEAYARMLMGTNLREARRYCKMAVDQGYEPAKELLATLLKALGGKT